MNYQNEMKKSENERTSNSKETAGTAERGTFRYYAVVIGSLD
jgi:hypothetical protein